MLLFTGFLGNYQLYLRTLSHSHFLYLSPSPLPTLSIYLYIYYIPALLGSSSLSHTHIYLLERNSIIYILGRRGIRSGPPIFKIFLQPSTSTKPVIRCRQLLADRLTTPTSGVPGPVCSPTNHSCRVAYIIVSLLVSKPKHDVVATALCVDTSTKTIEFIIANNDNVPTPGLGGFEIDIIKVPITKRRTRQHTAPKMADSDVNSTILLVNASNAFSAESESASTTGLPTLPIPTQKTVYSLLEM